MTNINQRISLYCTYRVDRSQFPPDGTEANSFPHSLLPRERRKNVTPEIQAAIGVKLIGPRNRNSTTVREHNIDTAISPTVPHGWIF